MFRRFDEYFHMVAGLLILCVLLVFAWNIHDHAFVLPKAENLRKGISKTELIYRIRTENNRGNSRVLIKENIGDDLIDLLRKNEYTLEIADDSTVISW